MWCHAPDAAMQMMTPKAVSHSIEERDQCMMCHKPGAMEPGPDAPADAGRQVLCDVLRHA